MKKPVESKNKSAVEKIIEENNRGIRIDIGCGANKIPGWVGIDIRPLPGVDIVCDLEKYPWDLPDECASVAAASHVLEHIVPQKPESRLVGLIDLLRKKKIITEKEVEKYIGEYTFESTFIRFMDEVWRILKPGGEFLIRVPYADTMGFYQDPTHVNPLTEATFYYFDPFHTSGLFKIYRPKPWEIVHCFWDTDAIMEVLLVKRKEDESFMQHKNLSLGRPVFGSLHT